MQSCPAPNLLRLLCLLGWCCWSRAGQAQETPAYSRPPVAIPDPVYVLNSTIIINGLVSTLPPEAIKRITVYKGPASVEAENPVPVLSSLGLGVLDITARKRVRSRSFAQLGRKLGLRGPLRFALNGHPLQEQAVAALRIAPAAIGQLHILRPTAEQPETRVDIWLTLPAATDYRKHPPGTILLR